MFCFVLCTRFIYCAENFICRYIRLIYIVISICQINVVYDDRIKSIGWAGGRSGYRWYIVGKNIRRFQESLVDDGPSLRTSVLCNLDAAIVWWETIHSSVGWLLFLCPWRCSRWDLECVCDSNYILQWARAEVINRSLTLWGFPFMTTLKINYQTKNIYIPLPSTLPSPILYPLCLRSLLRDNKSTTHSSRSAYVAEICLIC